MTADATQNVADKRNRWTQKRLGDVCRPVGGGTPSRAHPEYWNGEIPWASVKDFAEDSIILSGTEEYITPDGLNNSASTLVPKDTPVVCTRMAVGRCALTTRPTAINQDLKALLLTEDFELKFFIRLLRFHARELERLSIGSTVRGISNGDLLALPLKYAEKPEQTRISAVLDAMDEVIAQTESLIAKLRQVRTGMLHDLLTRGLDHNGQLRDPIAHPEKFKESSLGLIPIEWSVGNISHLAQNRDARRVPLKQADRDLRHGVYPYYGASGVIDFVDDYLFDGTYVLIGEDGENLRSRQLPLAFIASGQFWVNNHAHVLEPLPQTDVRFLATLLEAQDYVPWLLGSAQPKLTQSNLGFVPLRIPPPEEQSLISDAVDSVGKQIRTEEHELDKLRQLKSGLATDLLTGSVRVPAPV